MREEGIREEGQEERGQQELALLWRGVGKEQRGGGGGTWDGGEGRGGEVQQLLLQQRLCQAHATGSPGVLEGRPGRVGGCGWLRLAGTGE